MSREKYTNDDVPESQQLSGWSSYYRRKIDPIEIPTTTKRTYRDLPSTSPYTYISPDRKGRDIPSTCTNDRPLYAGGPSSRPSAPERQGFPKIVKRDLASLAEGCKSTATTAITAPSRPDWRSRKGKTIQSLNTATKNRLQSNVEKGGNKVVANETDIGDLEPSLDYPYKAW